jgi:hypothetical protein
MQITRCDICLKEGTPFWLQCCAKGGFVFGAKSKTADPKRKYYDFCSRECMLKFIYRRNHNIETRGLDLCQS